MFPWHPMVPDHGLPANLVVAREARSLGHPGVGENLEDKSSEFWEAQHKKQLKIQSEKSQQQNMEIIYGNPIRKSAVGSAVLLFFVY